MIGLQQEFEKLSLFDELKASFPIKWNDDANSLLDERYLIKDDNGKPIETKEELIWRVCTALTQDPLQIEKFYHMMADGIFLPNTPTLVNAQRSLGMLSACLVLPTGDTIEDWGRTIYDHMIMTKAGIGTGVDLSPIRQKGCMISTTKGEAAGALAFLNLLNESAKTVKQGSIRPSANMATMRITHPSIMEFIKSKSSEYKRRNGTFVKVWEKFQHFNISITATDQEMEALFNDKEIPIIEPHTQKTIGHRRGSDILGAIAFYVWDGGDPGLLNLTRGNENNPIVNLINPLTGEAFGLKFTTNPCGEQWLYIYSVCNLGSINLTKFVIDGKFDYDHFAEYVEYGIEFLDAVIDVNKFAVEEINILSKHLRNIGLGIMGWADTLLMLGISYDSDVAIKLAESIMSVFKDSVDFSSHRISIRDGVAPVFRGTEHSYRNYERSCIAPTGSIATIIGVSTGIEPNFTFAYTRNTSLKNGKKFHIVNEKLKDYIKKNKPEQYYEIIDEIVNNKGLVSDEIAEKMGLEENYFRSSFDISPEWHIRHQAVFQKYVDNAVSKTINVPEEFTQEDIKDAYKLSWELGCKGITIYRNNSRSYQILTTNHDFNDGVDVTGNMTVLTDSLNPNRKEMARDVDNLINDKCCEKPNIIKEDGCTKCTNCNWSVCS